MRDHFDISGVFETTEFEIAQVACMFAYDKTFDPEVVLGHCDLISRFSDFALYLDTRLVYFHTFFRL